MAPKAIPRDAGFTLVELMVTLVVVSVFLFYAVPSFTQLYRNNQMTNQANSILGAVQLARAEAVHLGKGTAVCGSSDGSACDGSWGTGWIVFVDDSGNNTAPPTANDILRTATLKTGIDVATAGLFRFTPQGTRWPEGTAGQQSLKTVTIKRSTCGNEKARAITVEPGGRASAEEVAC
ncbi:MAG: GspH/FimT family pseudopilin [Alcanivorax sp.]|nr:GspH/FimT family pseudopilin [Alcanivorax sp.]